jgi:hypothetical protein
MEFTIRTMIIMVLGVIALLLLLAIFTHGQGQGKSIIDGLFDWFKVLGGGV